jgi:hypothetical protein
MEQHMESGSKSNGNETAKRSNILVELAHHFPFTILSAVFSLCLMAILTLIIEAPDTSGGDHDHGSSFSQLFHVFHPIHLLLSAMATTAMFWRFEKKLLKAVFVGLAGSLGVCGISDIIMPYAGGSILKIPMDFHLCLIERPILVVPFAALGVLVGLASTNTFQGRGATVFSHSAHVIVSTMASLLYLISFGFTGWIDGLFETLIIVILAVLIPCCLSDIFFPLLMVEKGRRLHEDEGHFHCHH